MVYIIYFFGVSKKETLKDLNSFYPESDIQKCDLCVIFLAGSPEEILDNLVINATHQVLDGVGLEPEGHELSDLALEGKL